MKFKSPEIVRGLRPLPTVFTDIPQMDHIGSAVCPNLAFPARLNSRRRARGPLAEPRGTPEDADLVVIKTHLSRGFRWNTCQLNTSRGRRIGRRPQLRDAPQDVGEEIFRDSNLGHLEGDVAAVAHDLRADLDQLFL